MSKKPKFRDPRNDLTDVWSPDGEKKTLTLTNAREMVRHSNWSFVDPNPTKEETPSDPAQEGPEADSTLTAVEDDDLFGVGKETLRKAAKVLNIDFDARSGDKRLAAQIEAELDKRLTDSGDVDGGEQVNEGDPEDVASRKLVAAAARRQRSFIAAAAKAAVTVEASASPSAVVEALAAKAE